MAKVRVGDPAPPFELDGTGSRSYRLADFRGERLIVAFYPGDFTPVCTKQFCSYRDDGDRIESLGVRMVGISPQSVESHERFSERHGLSVPLLSDPRQAGWPAPTASWARPGSSGAGSSSWTRRVTCATATSPSSACATRMSVTSSGRSGSWGSPWRPTGSSRPDSKSVAPAPHWRARRWGRGRRSSCCTV